MAADGEARAVRREREGGHPLLARDLEEDGAARRVDDRRLLVAAADGEARAVRREREGAHVRLARDLEEDGAARRVDDRRLLVVAADGEARAVRREREGDYLILATLAYNCEFLQCTVLGKHGAVSDDVTLRGRDVILFLNQAQILSRCRYAPGMP